MNTPTLKTARLTLSPPLMHEYMDVDHYLRWLTDTKVVQYSEQRHLEHTVETQRNYITSFNQGEVDGEYNQLWEIRRSANIIGSITSNRNVSNKTANLGIMIGDHRVWGSGYGVEAWDAVTTYLFEEGVRKVEAGCMRSNSSMRAVLNRAGFIEEAVLPNYFLLNGEPEDMLYHGKYNKAKVIPLKVAGK